jgi:hypothetical protein
VAKRKSAELDPDFDAEGFDRFRSAVLSRFVAVETEVGPRVQDLPEDEMEGRVEVALRARARWAKPRDFSRALVEPAVVVDRPEIPE